jgi:nucleoside-diphosphate kinase
MKLTSPSRSLLEQHYSDLKEKPFFPGLVTCEFPRFK